MATTEQNLIQALHLSRYEAKMYLAGLNFEQATLTQLAQAANIPRTAAYPPLQALLKRGLVSSVMVGKRNHYRSLEPRQLPYLFEREKVHLNEALSELNRQLSVPSGDFSVQYFPGIHGMNMAADIFLNESKGKLWKAFENPLPILEKTGERAFDNYIERRVKRGIHARVIIPANKTSPWIQERLKRKKEELIEVVMVSPNEYPIETSLAVSGDMIMMIMARAIPSTVLIRNKDLAVSLGSIHDMVWDRYQT